VANWPTLNIRRSGEQLLIAQITDTHLEAQSGGKLAGMDTDASLELVLEMLRHAERRPDVLLVTGDLASHGSTAAYGRLRDRIDALELPWVWLPGNHDDPRLMSEVLAHGAPMYRCLRSSEWQILLLDSTERNKVGGTLGHSELELLEHMLSSAEGRHTVVCMHHQPVPVGCEWLDEQRVSDADKLFALLDQFSDVQALLWGHVHQDFYAERNGVKLFATPSTCIQFKPGTEDFALDDLAPGMRWMTLLPDGRIVTEVQRVANFNLDYDRDSAGYM